MSTTKFLLATAFCTALISAQTTDDPFRGMNSHQIPHCSVRGGPESAKCSCIGMVADVQRAKARKCWKKAGFSDLEQIPEEFKLFPETMPDGVAECLADVPDHCQVVARTPAQWGYDGENTCRTSCKPERCGCADGPCAAHGAPGAEY